MSFIKSLARRTVSLLAIAVISVLSGCKTQPVNPPPMLPAYTAFHSPLRETLPLRRVVALPMENYTEYPEASDRVLASVVSDLRAAGMFDLVYLPPNEARQCHEQFALHGCYPDELLVELASRNRADGVMFTSLNTYHPYWPPRVGLKLHIVSTLEDVTLVSVDGLWDAQEACIASQAEAFYGISSADCHIPRPELAVYSPAQFERFVARQVVQAIAGPPPVSEQTAAIADGSASPSVDGASDAEIVARRHRSPYRHPRTARSMEAGSTLFR